MIPLYDNIKSRSKPVITVFIIVINALVFFYEFSLTSTEGLLETFIQQWGAVPANFLQNPVTMFPTLITAMFLHAGWGHFIGNMLYLWIFGDNVEDKLGHFRYFLFYVMCGLLAGLAQIYSKPAANVPLIGASGAIAGVLGGYFVCYPKARVLTLIPFGFFTRLIEVPAFYFLAFWFLIQAAQGLGSLTERHFRDGGGIAWWAHAGGFAAGMILIFLLRKRR